MSDFLEGIDPQDEQEYLQGLSDVVGKYRRQFLGQDFTPDEDSREAVQEEIDRIQKLYGVRIEKNDPERDDLAAYIAREKDPQKVIKAVRQAVEAKKNRVSQSSLKRQYDKEIAAARGHVHQVLNIRQKYRRKGLDI